MSVCQVYGCYELAVVRCDSDFRYCENHKAHTHSDFGALRPKAAIVRGIDRYGEFLWKRRKRK